MLFEMAESQTEKCESFLRVSVDANTYWIPAERVRRVIAAMPLYEVPGGRSGVFLARFGGEPLAIIELAESSPYRRWKDERPVVVVWVGGADRPETVGLAVDRAHEVVTLGAGESDQGGPASVRSNGSTAEILDLNNFKNIKANGFSRGEE